MSSRKIDRRLTGDATEYILAWLLRNKYGVISQIFDVEGIDLIAFDPTNKVFAGKSPFFLQVKTRSGGNPLGIGKGLKAIRNAIENLKVHESSVYLAVGFFEEDIRGIEFYLIPWKDKDKLYSKSEKELRLSKKKLDSLEFRKI